ncbi:MAG TPA: hypothetical protein VGA69_08070, partial [Nitriliruptorales bacterium]
MPQSHPEVQIAEPYYGAVGAAEVQAASALSGQPLGLYLDDHDAQARVDAARSEVEVLLAVAGVAPQDRLSLDLHAAGEALHLDGDPAVSAEAARALRAVVAARVIAPLRLVGVEPSGAVTGDELRIALSAIGHDAGGRLDAGDVAALERAAAARVAPLIHASGHHPGARVDAADLDVMVRAVGHDPGTATQAGDVVAALGRA